MHVQRERNSFLADVLTYFRVITLLLLLFVEVVGLEALTVVFGCCAWSLCMFELVRGISVKLLLRFVENQ